MPVGDGDHPNSRSIWPGRKLPSHRILIGPAIPDMAGTDGAGNVNLPRQCLDRYG